VELGEGERREEVGLAGLAVGRLAAQGRSLLVSSHVMDEASRCDRLLLLREGELLADETLPALLARTGTHDAEEAFLALIDRAAQEAR
jgi:ABC-2 type transport system ATP-binding protein